MSGKLVKALLSFTASCQSNSIHFQTADVIKIARYIAAIVRRSLIIGNINLSERDELCTEFVQSATTEEKRFWLSRRKTFCFHQ